MLLFMVYVGAVTTITTFVYVHHTLFAYIHNQPLLSLIPSGWGTPHGGADQAVGSGNVAMTIREQMDGVRQKVTLIVDAQQTLLKTRVLTRWFRE